MTRTAPQSLWLTAMDWLKAIDRKLPSVWPSEFPPESAPGFWTQAAQLEMKHRQTVSVQTAEMIRSGRKPDSITPLQLWFYRRRVEWAAQLFLAKAEEGVEPDAQLPEVLTWALITSWDSDGCIGFWNHAVERGGQPHPMNPNGLSPV